MARHVDANEHTTEPKPITSRETGSADSDRDTKGMSVPRFAWHSRQTTAKLRQAPKANRTRTSHAAGRSDGATRRRQGARNRTKAENVMRNWGRLFLTGHRRNERAQVRVAFSTTDSETAPGSEGQLTARRRLARLQNEFIPGLNG
jgi:hypothetical protein